MIKTHILGLPRIGPQRELKFALENYWQGRSAPGQTPAQTLLETAQQLEQRNFRRQQGLDLITAGDFSLYDHVLDHSQLFGILPALTGHAAHDASPLDRYFATARGFQSGHSRDGDSHCDGGCTIAAAQMTKWFDTNYHYLVPEISEKTRWQPDFSAFLQRIRQAQASAGDKPVKPVLLGPVSFLWLSRSVDGSPRLAQLDRLLPLYASLLNQLHALGIEWVQVDEPVICADLEPEWLHALQKSYHLLKQLPVKILLATYFGDLGLHLKDIVSLPVAGLHIDAVRGRQQVSAIVDQLPEHRILSLGVIDGRNIWRADLPALARWLQPIARRLPDRLWLSASCSLLHVPEDLNLEESLPASLKNRLAFAEQKLEELNTLARLLDQLQVAPLAQQVLSGQPAYNDVEVRPPVSLDRNSPFKQRAVLQQKKLKLPLFPTTTIGSFPQTADIRQQRAAYKKGQMSEAVYEQFMQQQIARTIAWQEETGLDVLVHGEAERNDMVEYFAAHLEGYAFTEAGWVQSYGSRCVKPPIIYDTIRRPRPITVKWTQYAQSLTAKPVKGMLTGPVTLLNWSFVRDDQPRSQTCLELALALRQEVLELEAAGTSIIQIDEAALREGLPLRRADWPRYLQWAIDCFRVMAAGVQDHTQIHTHMCYSQFNDIMPDIARMDADVITIETSRSKMQLLDAFQAFAYPNAIGPGVYDIHSPSIPAEADMVQLLTRALQYLQPVQLWVNPDCGLKTRNWDEVAPALKHMVNAAVRLRSQAGQPENAAG